MGIDADMFNSPEWMSEALRIGNTGLWAIEIDEENGKHRYDGQRNLCCCLLRSGDAPFAGGLFQALVWSRG